MKFSKSNMHFYKNIVLFQGEEKATEGEYFFKESLQLFAVENLAVNLIELERTTEVFDLSAESTIKTFFKEVDDAYEGRTNIMDVRLTESLANDGDIECYYTKESFTDLNIEVFSDALSTEGGFNAVFYQKGQITNNVIKEIDHSKHRYMQIIISQAFLKRASVKLSDSLVSGFDPKRYVDSNILFFLLMTMLSGTARAEIN